MDEDRLPAIMAALADGDPAALVELIDQHGGALAGAVRRIAAARGSSLDPDEVDELVVDAALAIMAVAGGWSVDGGARPWVWAHHQVAAVVDRHIGQHSVPLDEAMVTEHSAHAAAPAREPAVVDLVVTLAARHPQVALLHEALGMVASPRDQELFLETALQTALGDRSPAVTVGRALGMAPASVRQQHRRVRMRVQRLASCDERFAPLGCLPIVA